MTAWNQAYVPDELWAKFGKEVDHFEYDDRQHVGVAVYVDGRRESFDTTVTKAMLDEEWERSRRATIAAGGMVQTFSFTVDFSNARGCIYNGGA